MPKWLVIDASVAHDAKNAKLGCINCFNILELTKKLGYYVVMTPFISKEWTYVGSQYALTWRGEMISKGRLRVNNFVTIKKNCACLNGAIHSEKCLREMLKDFPLIIAALKTDKTVISKDDAARRLFADASNHIIEMKIIAWVNPSHDEERSIHWLEAGAENETRRQLSHFFDNRKIRSITSPDEAVFEMFFAEACSNAE